MLGISQRFAIVRGEQEQFPDMDEPAAKKAKTSGSMPADYIIRAEEAVVFRIIEPGTGKDLQDVLAEGGQAFTPEYFHQVFGEEEEIKGYKDLAIDVWMCGATFHTWIDIQYEKQHKQADDLHKLLAEAFGTNYVRTEQEFQQLLTASRRADAGPEPKVPRLTELGTCIRNVSMPDGSTLYIQLHKLAKADPTIRVVHQRLEPLLLFTIDGASAVDSDDEDWDLMLAVKKTGDTEILVGFSTLYNFWAYDRESTDCHRLRLSQILVLPPYQGQGAGMVLLQCAYQLAKERGCVDLTLEDPTPNLQRLRERYELSVLRDCTWVMDRVKQALQALTAGDTCDAARSTLRLSKEEVEKVQQEFKIHKKEVQKVWESLLCGEADCSVPQVKTALQQLISARLEAEHLEQKQQYKKCVVPVDCGDANDSADMFFVMTRVKGGDAESSKGAEAEEVNVGRLNITSISVEERTAKLEELVKERMEHIESIMK